MAKNKHSRAQESFLIVFVAVCCVLVAATLLIAFDEARTNNTPTETPEGAYGYPAGSGSARTATPFIGTVTPPPTWDPRTKEPTLTF